MTDEEQQPPNDKPDKPLEETPPIMEKPITDTIGNDDKAKAATEEEQEKTKKFEDIKPTQRNDGNVEEFKANRIGRKQLIIDSLLLFCTLIALFFTWKSVISSNKAVDVSIASLAYAREKDSADKIHQKEIDSINHIKDSLSQSKDSATINLANQSLQAQINSIKESQHQFRIQNEPYVQIDSVTLGNIGIGNRIIVNYYISNLKDIPVKMIRSMTGCGSDTIAPDIEKFKTTFNKGGSKFETQVNYYIIRGAPQKRFMTDTKIMRPETMAGLVDKNLRYYFLAAFEYKNLATGEHKNYFAEVEIKIYKDMRIYVDFLYNENEDINQGKFRHGGRFKEGRK